MKHKMMVARDQSPVAIEPTGAHDIQLFFENQILGRDEHAWASEPPWPVRTRHGRRVLDINAFLAQEEDLLTHSRVDDLASSLTAITSAFMYQSMWSRLASLEHAFAIHVANLTPPAEYAALSDLMPEVEKHREVIENAFARAFGVAGATATFAPSTEGPFAVVARIDSSQCDQATIAEARISGARAHFYELVSAEIDAEVLDHVDFELFAEVTDR